MSVILSIVGFFVTCFLLWEARKIRNSFMRKARIPEIVVDLNEIAKDLFQHMKKFSDERWSVQEKIQNARGLLEGVLPKMENGHKEKISDFISTASSLNETELSEDSCWQAYTQLSSLVSYLQQLEKDTKWEQ